MTQHYLFAYRMLVPLCLSEPGLAPLRLASSAGKDMLRSLWIHAGQHSQLTGTGPSGCREGAGLNVETHGDTVVVTLPPPHQPPEAYYLGLVGGRVYALEMGEDFETGQTATFLCEWTDQGHANFGSRGLLTTEQFVLELKKLS